MKPEIIYRTSIMASLIIFTAIHAADILADDDIRYLDRLKDTQPYVSSRTGPQRSAETSITIEAAYNNNIYSDNQNKKADFITLLHPHLALNSVRQDRFSLETDIHSGNYASYSKENFTDYAVNASAALFQGRSSALNSGVRHARKHILRGSPDDEKSLRPGIYFDTSLYADYNFTSNRFVTMIEVEDESFNYLDSKTITTTINNDDRDRTDTSGKLIFGYIYRPPFESLYLMKTVNKTDHRRIPDDNGYNRDSLYNEIMSGITYGNPELLYAEINAKWLNKSFDDPLFTTITKTAVGGNISWAATKLTRLDLISSHSIIETTSAGASSILFSNVKLAITHELLRTLKLTIKSAQKKYEFIGINRTDKYTEYGMSMKYALNRNIQLAASASYTDRNSNSAASINDFEKTILMVSGRLKF